MPKVIEYTPPWLSRPSRGFSVFTPKESIGSRGTEANGIQRNGIASTEPYMGPKRLLAQRGTEVFVAAGNKIRWTDLCMLKEDYEAERDARANARRRRTDGGLDSERQGQHSNPQANAYMVCVKFCISQENG